MEVKIMGVVLGEAIDWDAPSEDDLIFYEFTPSHPILNNSGDLRIQVEEGLLTILDVDKVVERVQIKDFYWN